MSWGHNGAVNNGLYLYMIDLRLKDPGSLIHPRLMRDINNHLDYKTLERVTGTRQKYLFHFFTKKLSPGAS